MEMLDLYTVLLVIVLAVLLVIGLLVLLRNPRQKLNQAYFAVSLSMSTWLTTNYFANDTSLSNNAALLSNRVTLVTGGLAMLSIYVFIICIAGRRLSKKMSIIGLLALCFAWVASLTPLVVSSVELNQGVYVNTFGILSVYYFLSLFVQFCLISSLLIRGHFKLNGILKAQIDTIIVTFIITIPIVLVCTAVLPILGNYNLAGIGSLSLAFWVIGMAYAITRHRLFDLRLVVARTLGYVLSLGSLAAAAAAALLVASGYLSRLGANDDFLRLFYVITTVVLALTYLPAKRFFDRVTNKLFYRDAYDTKDLLDEFNQAIVSTIELEKLLAKSAGVIEKYLRSEFCTFALIDEEQGVRVLHTQNTEVTEKVIDQMRSYISSNKTKLMLTDLLEAKETDLKALLVQENIAVVARITKSTNSEGVGYMVLGNKKSGTIYNSQDTDAMEIVTNELAIAIENALQYEEIQNFAKTLEGKVDEATRNLRKANEKLKAMDQTKDDFISMASHQLRTPLTSVKGYVSMVLEGDAGKVNSKQKELLDQAFVSSQRMVYLIADLLNVSRLRTGKFIIEAKPTNLADVVEGEIAQLTETAKGRGLELTYQKPKNFPALMLDETKIRQVIMNFADNAIYYTPTGGHIKVELEDLGDSIEFRVVDDGLGVPKSEQHHLFGKFYRASNAKKARPDGTGLGLFMAKKVVVAQGGAIVFKTQEGKGSTFGFNFAKKPLEPEHLNGATSSHSKEYNS